MVTAGDGQAASGMRCRLRLRLDPSGTVEIDRPLPTWEPFRPFCHGRPILRRSPSDGAGLGGDEHEPSKLGFGERTYGA
jgi:hypothetical protein